MVKLLGAKQFCSEQDITGHIYRCIACVLGDKAKGR